MNEFITWEYLGTFAGIVAVVLLIVQWLKVPADRVWKIPTRFIVFFITLVLMFAMAFFQGDITSEIAFMTVLNSIVVTMAVLGTYDVTVKKLEQRKAPPKNKEPI